MGWFIFGGCALGIIAVGLMTRSVSERSDEARISRVQFMTNIDEFEGDNAKWGQNFPREYKSWEMTKEEKSVTKFGGSQTKDYLAMKPELVIIFAGMPFSKDFKTPRGHYHAVDDVKQTGRINEKSPGTCWTCKSSDVPKVMNRDGVDKYYAEKFKHYEGEIKNSIGCADCHDSKTMALTISRPALVEAYERQGKDIKKASQQEMRSLVCAQCHVEYYFKGKKEKYLTFPWDDGMTIEAMEKYYEKSGHIDWTHAISGAKMVKMQHPDYEVYAQGVHAYRNVSCADCHMPYKSEGGIKYTDHQVKSPLTNVANSCQVCHRWSEEEIKNRVTAIQEKNDEMLRRAEHQLTMLHLEIGDAIRLGAKDADLEKSRKLVSTAQMYWDYVAANNGMGFHAPQECARILGKALGIAMDGRLNIQSVRAKFGAAGPINMPDIGTKESAQAYIKPFADALAAAQKAKEEAEKAAAAAGTAPKQ